MKKLCFGAVSIIACLCILVGCAPQHEDIMDVEDKQLENPFEQKDEEMETTVMGTISHGVLWGDNNTYTLSYEGGEMEIPYFMKGSGIAKNCGFFIFLDGIPQPYKVKGMDEDYQYMHLFELKENKDEAYVFQFMPVTGKEGEQLSICIASITNPEFIPDMKDSVSYGHSHKALEAIYPILFQSDAEQDKALSEAVNENRKELLKEFELMIVETDQNFVNELEQETQIGSLDLEKDVITRLYISGESMRLSETADITGKQTIHVKYIILGHPGAEYKTIFYLNHEPLAYKDTGSFLTVLKKGQMGVIEFDLDTAELENSTFYAISVPCNDDDYPDDVLMMCKSNSVTFYQEK